MTTINKTEINIVLNEHQKNITKILLTTLLEEPGLSLSYEQIAEKAGIGKEGAISIGNSIGKISELCYQLGFPLLSVKVYSKNGGTPSEGFYDLYKRLTGNPKHLSEKEAVTQEIKDILNCEHWQLLSDYLDLNLDMNSFRDVETIYPEEITQSATKFFEGTTKKISVNKYERNPQARNLCIKKKGTKCLICDFDFGKVYGANFANKIHVHHLVPISQINEKYELNPEKDLIPVCPNCHMILHSKGNNDVYTVEQVKMFIEMHNKSCKI